MRTTLTLILTMLATFCQGECPIECYCDQVTTCSGDKLLTRFPHIYPTFSHNGNNNNNNAGPASSSSWTTTGGMHPTRLELHDFNVQYLSREEFLGLAANLTEISLSRNSLEKIDNATFSSRPSTTQLSEEGHFFPAHLSQPPSADAASFILKLRILDLSQNKLTYFVGGGLLGRVKILDLSSNALQQVYHLSRMESLESVNLRDNRISYLDPTIFQVR
jgi:hypothetical protein